MNSLSPTWFHEKEKSKGNIILKKVFSLDYFKIKY